VCHVMLFVIGGFLFSLRYNKFEELAPRLPAGVQLIESNCHQDEGADCDLQIKRVDGQQVSAVVQHADDECTAGGANRATASPREAGSADDAGRDRLQFEASASSGHSGAEARGQQHTAHGGERAGDHVDRGGDHGHWDTSESGRLRIGPHRVDVAAEHGAIQDEPGDRRDDHEDDQQVGNAQNGAASTDVPGRTFETR
jgi:hypothetical protein